MKRYPVFAVAVLLFLLAMLLGSWVYLNNYPWPFFGDDTQAASDSDGEGRTPGEGDDPFADAGEAADSGEDADGDNREGGPLEAPDEPVRRAKPPESVSTRKPGSISEPAGAKEEVVVELKPGVAGVNDGSGGDANLDEFIVSTLPPARFRAAEHELKGEKLADRCQRHASALVVSDDMAGLGDLGLAGMTEVLIGRLVWPQLNGKETKAVKDADRRQACVYVKGLPEFREIVSSDEGWFMLYLTKTLGDEFREKGLDVVVHSPAFRIQGGYDSIRVKKDRGALEIALEIPPMFELTVNVTPESAVKSGVRVWVERLGEPETPDFDDSLYISAKVPTSGKLTFLIPEHYGTLNFGATGRSWHSGLSQTTNFGTRKGAEVALTLAAEPCDMVSGKVVTGGDTPIKGARLVSTHFGATTYSAPSGAFDMYVPFDSYQSTRQFITTYANYRPEVIPLESRGDPTPGVEGSAPHGPWTARLGYGAEIEVELPKTIKTRDDGRVWINGQHFSLHTDSRKTGTVKAELPWGRRLVRISMDSSTGTPYWVPREQWEAAFRAYAAGKTMTIEPEGIDDIFRKR